MRKKFRRSKLYNNLIQIAVENEEILFPHEAMDILQTAYGKRLDYVCPATLKMMVTDICLKNGHEPDGNEIVESINYFINN